MRSKELLVAMSALVLVLAACDDSETDVSAEPSTSSTSSSSTSSTAADDPAGGSTSGCPIESDGAEADPSAVAADLDGDGESDAAWVEAGTDEEPPMLVTRLASGAVSELALEEDPAVEPEIVSVVDIGEDRDSLLVRVGTGAYTMLSGVFGFSDCAIQPIVDPESSRQGPFLVGEGASVRNGSYYGCFTRDGETALVTGGWSTNEAGEKEWSEGLLRREGLEIVQAGEAVAGVAETEEGIGTDRAEPCPEPVRA